MEWTKQKLAHYLGDIRVVVKFEGISGEELERVFHGEAMNRLQQIEDIVCNEYLSAEEKVSAIGKVLESL